MHYRIRKVLCDCSQQIAFFPSVFAECTAPHTGRKLVQKLRDERRQHIRIGFFFISKILFKRNALRKVRFDKIDRVAFVHIVQLLLHDIRCCRAELFSCPQIRRSFFVVQIVPPNLFSDAVKRSLGRCQFRKFFDDFFRIVVRKFVNLQAKAPQSLRRTLVQRKHLVLCVAVVVHILVRYRVIWQQRISFLFIQVVCFAGKRSLI